MTVTNTSMAMGSWSIKLSPSCPQDVLDRLRYLGHIAISIGRPDPRVSGDSLLRSARFVGPLRKITYAEDGAALAGAGMSFWLGDENDKGPIILEQLLFVSANFQAVVNQILDQTLSVRAGTIHELPFSNGGYTGYHQYVTIRKALDFVVSTMTADTEDPTEWRVNGDGTVDCGTASQLYIHDDPIAAIVRKGSVDRIGSADLLVRTLPGNASVDEDVEDYATEVILLGQGEGLGIASAQAVTPEALIPYKDIYGNTVRIARTVSQSSTDAANSLQQAEIALAQYANPRDAVTLTTDQFDVSGTVNVGDSVWVYDPASGMVDRTADPNQLIFRGERINPVKLRVSEVTWPVEAGMSVAYRTPDGEWIDLTDYVIFETGTTSLTVGGYDRSLTNPSGRQEALGSRAAPNTSVPDVPEFHQPFAQAVYQSSATGISKAQIQIRWFRPTNTDGTDIIDGDHYEIRYRTAEGDAYRRPAGAAEPEPVYPGSSLFPSSASYPGEVLVGGSAAVIPPGTPSTWAQCAGLTWEQMATWAQPIEYIAGPWLVNYAAFDTTQLLIQELTPGVPYQFQIRAVDNAVPPNFSEWSDSVLIEMALDTIPPPTPAPPEVAASLIAIQVLHNLGAASGGTFNLPADMHHFEVHAEHEPTFTCSPATLLGKIAANNGMIVSQTPVVSTLQVQSTEDLYFKVVAVDEAGNRSNPSAAVQATAELIDDAHISDLTVSKVTAGTISANWLLAAEISTAPDGVRAGMDRDGLFAVNNLNTRNWEVNAATGDMVAYTPAGVPTMRIEAATGNVYLYKADGVTPAMRLTASAGLLELTGKVIAGAGVDAGATIVVDPVAVVGSAGDQPELRFYPNASGEHYALFAFDINGPDGSVGANYGFHHRNSAAERIGPFMQSWTSGHWIASRGVADTFDLIGGFVKLYNDAANGYSAYLGSTLGVNECLVQVRPDQIDILGLNGAKLQLNADGSVLLGGPNNGFVSIDSGGGAQLVSGGVVKAFTIDHPDDPKRWLVHGCTESPVAGVHYTGEVVIADGWAMAELPSYFESLTKPGGRNVQVSPVSELCLVAADPIAAGRFRIRCDGPDGTRVQWHVFAERRGADFDPEPRRESTVVHRVGPYSWHTPLPEED